MKVYIVCWENGESYEDFRHDYVGVFSSYEKAEKYILNQGFTRHEIFQTNSTEWIAPNKYGAIESMWINEENVR